MNIQTLPKSTAQENQSRQLQRIEQFSPTPRTAAEKSESLHNFAFLAGLVIMLMGLSSTLGAPSFDSQSFAAGVTLLMAGMGLGIFGGLGSDYA